jgi:hypothetical protein
MRHLLALLVGAAVAALGGLIVGEYPFTGLTPYVAGVLFGLVVAEVVVTIAKTASLLLAAASAALAAAGLAYAVWDDAGYGVRPVSVSAWIGVAIAAAVAGLRSGGWREIRRDRNLMS